jgi:hypothetical protein
VVWSGYAIAARVLMRSYAFPTLCQ